MRNKRLAQNLQAIADAVKNNEPCVHVNGKTCPVSVAMAETLCLAVTITRIPKPTPKIKVGDRIINAPMQEKPAGGSEYWFIRADGGVGCSVWADHSTDVERLTARNCWRTEDDAQAYAEASLALRSTLVEGGEV